MKGEGEKERKGERKPTKPNKAKTINKCKSVKMRNAKHEDSEKKIKLITKQAKIRKDFKRKN
ncbi:MAG: hypothetical protein ACP5RD_08490 [bacterium]